MNLTLTAIESIPIVQPYDHLATLIAAASGKTGISWENGDILVITQKIVSKAENRFINLRNIEASPRAVELAAICEKYPRLVEIILSESKSVVRCVKDSLIVEHRLGFICANAGVDHSNGRRSENPEDTWYLLLPVDPDASARQIRTDLLTQLGVQIGIMIIDSHGRAWRKGVVGITIGTAGVPHLVDLRGKEDLLGVPLKITQVAVADELAATASLMMGQADELKPVMHVRGFPYPLRESKLSDVLRPVEKDLFR